MNKLELLIDAKTTLGEGPSWDHSHQLLYWVDIMEKCLFLYDPLKDENRKIEIDQYVGAVVPTRSSGVLLALHHGFYALDLEREVLTPIVDPEAHLPDNRFNDGKCDSMGRFWAGTTSLSGKMHSAGLYRLDADQSLHPVLSGISISNGLGWSPDNKTMYYIDTATQCVQAFDFDSVSGAISNGRTAVSIPEYEGAPDGMAVDQEGMLWIAHWGGWQVARWNPMTGEKLETVHVPASLCTSCVFGGADLNELYITTARYGLNEEELAHQPSAGGVFRIKTGVKGIRTFVYGEC